MGHPTHDGKYTGHQIIDPEKFVLLNLCERKYLRMPGGIGDFFGRQREGDISAGQPEKESQDQNNDHQPQFLHARQASRGRKAAVAQRAFEAVHCSFEDFP